MRRVVVTGIGAVTPIGNTAKDTWDNMLKGVCGIGRITGFDTTEYKIKLAAEIKNFNIRDYMSKSQADRQDTYSQYAYVAAEEAVNDSKLDISRMDPYKIGVYVSSGIGGFDTFLKESKTLYEKGPRRISPFFVPKIIGNMAAANIAIRYGAKGATLPVVTACATSTNAIGEAFRNIKHGYSDVIIAGGSEAAVNPLAIAGFTSCQALNDTEDIHRASIPFDKDRKGFVMGEGSAVLVLEELEHALARNAKIYGEIVGYGNTCDAYHMTAPEESGTSAARSILLGLNEANIDLGEFNPNSIYINAHGTSTVLNDKTETKAIKIAFGDIAKEVFVSSTKSMTGHMLGAAGAIEAIASLKAIETGLLPPNINYKNPDEECDLNLVLNESKKANIKLSVSNSLGFGGHNASLVFKTVE